MKMIKAILIALLVLASGLLQADTIVRVARFKGFGTHQPMLVHIIRLLPKYAKQNGVNDLKIEEVFFKEGKDANLAMVGGKVDVITQVMGNFFPVYNITKGNVKVLHGVTVNDYFLYCVGPNFKTPQDILKNQPRVYMHTIGATPSALLKKISYDLTGDYNKLDGLVSIMSQNDQVTDVVNNVGTVRCGNSFTPYQNAINKNKNVNIIAKYQQTAGTWATVDWINANPGLAMAWIQAANEAAEYLQKNPADAYRYWIKIDDVNDTLENILRLEKENDRIWSTKHYDLVPLASELMAMKMIDPVSLDGMSSVNVVWKNNLLMKK